MKTKSTVGRLITHLSKWRESGGYAALTLHHRSTRMGIHFMGYDKG